MDKDEKFFTDRGYEIKDSEQKLTPSMEDYLEMIYRLSRKKGYCRVNDIADRLNVQPPSVTYMAQKLHERGLLNYKKYGMIHLTSEGKELGKYFLKRHNIIKEFLEILGAEKLHKDVERIEHHLSQDNFELIYTFLQFLKDNKYIIEKFKEYKKS